MNRLTVVGHYGSVSETVYVFLNTEPEPVDTIESVITYGGVITIVGDEGVLDYPVDYDPEQVSRQSVLDLPSYRPLATRYYRGNTVLSGELSSGIYYIEGGDVIVEDGTTLNGSIMVTGSITLAGSVEINAMPAPGGTAYYPALTSMQSVYAQPRSMALGDAGGLGGAARVPGGVYGDGMLGRLSFGVMTEQDQRIREAEQRVREAYARVQEAQARLQEAELRILEAQARVQEAEQRVLEAQARVSEIEARILEARDRLRRGDRDAALRRISRLLEQRLEAQLRVRDAQTRVIEAQARVHQVIGHRQEAEVHVQEAEQRLREAERVLREVSGVGDEGEEDGEDPASPPPIIWS